MDQNSVIKSSYLRIAKLSIFYSFSLLMVVSLFSYFYFKELKKAEINKTIAIISNSVSSEVLEQNYSVIVKKIQQQAHLQELLVFDSSCVLLASSTLGTLNGNCHEETWSYSKATVVLNGAIVSIYYRYHYPIKNYLKENSSSLILFFLLTLIFTTIILYSFLRTTFIIPIRLVKSQISKDKEISLPYELTFISETIKDLKEKISLNEKRNTQYELAKRVIHDIRNPLISLRFLSNNIEGDETLFLKKIEEIEYQINKLLKKEENKEKNINLTEIFDLIKSENEMIFPVHIKTSFSGPSTIRTKMAPEDFKNIFSNLIRNAYEANSEKIEIEVRRLNNIIEIKITDDGQGIDKSANGKIFNNSFTTKQNGHGIGLSSIRDTLAMINASITYNSQFAKGAQFLIQIPVHNFHEQVVLIDDDKFIHLGWKKEAEKSSVKLNSFFSVDAFLKDAHLFLKHVPIFIDSDLGRDSEKGEILAEKIYAHGFSQIYLATSFTEVDISDKPWITSVVDKRCPLVI